MPIGKNAIKRVENNGYSKVKTDAPDMENSTVAEKKASVKKAPAKATVKPQEKKAPAKKAAEGKDEFAYINLGKELPTYLL